MNLIHRLILAVTLSGILAACETGEAIKVSRDIAVTARSADTVLADWEKKHSGFVSALGQRDQNVNDLLKASYELRVEYQSAKLSAFCDKQQAILQTKVNKAMTAFSEGRKPVEQGFDKALSEQLLSVDTLIAKLEQEASAASAKSLQYSDDPSLQLDAKTKEARYFALILARNALSAQSEAELKKELDAASDKLHATLTSEAAEAYNQIKANCEAAVEKIEAQKAAYKPVESVEYPTYEAVFADMKNFADNTARGSDAVANYMEANLTAKGILKQVEGAVGKGFEGAAQELKTKISLGNWAEKSSSAVKGIVSEAEKFVGDQIDTYSAKGAELVSGAINKAYSGFAEKAGELKDKVEKFGSKLGAAS